MKKIAIILCISMMSALAGCNKGVKEEKVNTAPKIEIESVEEKVVEEEDLTLSDDLYSFEIIMNGNKYKIPFKYEELKSEGWTIEYEETETLEPSQYGLVSAEDKNGTHTMLSLINFTKNVIELKDSYVGAIKIDEYYGLDNFEIILPKGITIGSSLEEIIEAYGEPSDTYESDLYTSITYEADIYKEIEFYIDKETNRLTEIDMQNFEDEPADLESNASSTVEDEAYEYEAPNELGDDILSFNVKADEVVYHLPVPFSVMEAEGWVIETKPSDEIAAKSSTFGFVLRKGNIKFRASFSNLGNSVATPEKCMVTAIKSDIYDNNIFIELPKGITMNSSEEDIMKAYGESIEREEEGNYIYFTAKEKVQRDVSIVISSETGKITSIEVQYIP